MSGRSNGDNVYIVTSSWFNSYDTFTKYLDIYNQTIYGTKPTESFYRNKARQEAESHLDAYVDQLTSELDCESMQKLALLQNTNEELNFAGMLESMATVYSFAASNASATKSVTSMLLPTGIFQVYASAERLVLACEGWWIDEAAKQETYLITYKLDGPTAKATTLGTVPGYVLNQFSIDHAKQNGIDYLRVATSTRDQWGFVDGGWKSSENSTSQVTVLEFNDNTDGKMPVVGRVNKLGKPGEQIYSVRFLGDQGFVVTFEQTDPFYTLDLSKPSSPQLIGKLEIPGFSN
jgi:uncharacterized secreted protein with C-terminal beta-propeller domain